VWVRDVEGFAEIPIRPTKSKLDQEIDRRVRSRSPKQKKEEGAVCCSAQGSIWDAGFIPTLVQQVQEGLGRVRIRFQSI